MVQNVHDWQLIDELAVAAYWVNDYSVRKPACEMMLGRIERGMEVPHEDVRRVPDNLAFADAKLAQA